MGNRPIRQSLREMEAACDRFNEKHRPGDTITVYTGLYGENPKRAEVRYPAEVMGGHTAVVYVTGGAHGSVALTHVVGE